MKKISLFVSLVILLSLLFAFAPDNQALANTIDKYTLEVNDVYPVDNSLANCGFEITEYYFGEVTVIEHFDKNGTWTGAHAIYGQMNAVWSAHGKSEKLQPYGPLTVQIQPDGDLKWVSLGAAHILTLPHYGIVAGFAGLDTFTIDGDTGEIVKVAQNGHFDTYNWEAVCEYFSE
jgi:hypothetical protein